MLINVVLKRSIRGHGRQPSTIFAFSTCKKNLSSQFFDHVLLVLLVNDSEYSKSADEKPILSPGCIYFVSPGARCCCCGSCGFLLLLLRSPTPPRPPFFGGREVSKKKIACSVGDGVWTCLCRRGRGGGRVAV
jgi:hypothetical protein